MIVQFHVLTGLMLGFEYVASEDTLVIDLLILRVLFSFGESNDY